MKLLFKFGLTILLITLTLYSFFYWKIMFYIIFGIFLIFLVFVVWLFVLAINNYIKVNYIDYKLRRRVNKDSNLVVYDSFVYLHLQEKVINNKVCLTGIIMKKYINKMEKETKIISMENEYDKNVSSQIVAFKDNLPLVFMNTYDFALLIKKDNYYNNFGNNNSIITKLIKKHKKYLIEYQMAYIENGLVYSACDKMIELYLKIGNEKSE